MKTLLRIPGSTSIILNGTLTDIRTAQAHKRFDEDPNLTVERSSRLGTQDDRATSYLVVAQRI